MVFLSFSSSSRAHCFRPLNQERHWKQNTPFFSVHHFPSSDFIQDGFPASVGSTSPSTVPSELNFIDTGVPVSDSVSTVAPVRSFAISSEDKASAEAVAEKRPQRHTEQRKRKRFLIFASRSSRRCRTGPPVAMTFITIGAWNQSILVRCPGLAARKPPQRGPRRASTQSALTLVALCPLMARSGHPARVC